MATIPSNGEGRGASGSIRVLVVEDFEPFRRFVCSTLGKRPKLQVIGDAVDGLEGVQKAEELQPDLILLDVGLPALNGIEAARRIRTLSPESKILFVSQESDADVVQEAFRVGALGYVVKTRVGNDLLAAAEMVCQGKRFVSAGLAGHVPAELADGHVPKSLRSDDVLGSLPETED
jgi:DNA-binding NarL/FixJ family response regulator